MATFAAYASQYLGRQQQQQQQHGNGSSALMSTSSSQPMFFSFTTDGRNDMDLDDLDDPHLNMADDDEDPYLRLDEDEHAGAGPRTQQSTPLLPMTDSSPPGWLAHLANSPRRSLSPEPSSDDDDESSPPADLLVPPSIPPPPRTYEPPSLSLSLTDSLLPRDARGLHVFSLPDPRHTPRRRRKHHDAPFIALFLFLLSLCLFFTLLLLVFTERPRGVPAALLPYAIMLRTVPILSVLTILSAVLAYAHVYLLRLFVRPVMLATEVAVPVMLLLSALWAFVGSFMWEAGVEPTWGETVGLRLFSLVPLLLFLLTARRLLQLPRQIHTTSSILALSTRILMANPFLLALSPLLLLSMLILSIPFLTLVFRLLLIGYKTTAPGGKLEWHVKAWANWAIAAALCVWVWSWAVARGVLRTTCAGVVGAWYFADPTITPTPPLNFLSPHTLTIPTLSSHPSTHTLHAALTRSTGPSLGSIILAALLLTLLRLLSLLILILSFLPPLLLRVPPLIPWAPLAVPAATWGVRAVSALVGWVEVRSGRVSKYALVYVGLTGVGFWEGAGRGGGVVSGRREVGLQVEEEPELGLGGRRARQQQKTKKNKAKKMHFPAEPPLALLTISPLTLTLPCALLTYLFVAHTLGAPNEALGAALLAGGVTAIVGAFCVGVVRDAADTLYMCYCIDKASGERRREEVFAAFEYGSEPEPEAPRGSGGVGGGSVLPLHHNQHQHQQQQTQQQKKNKKNSYPAQPETITIIPRSPLAARSTRGGGVGGDAGLARSAAGLGVGVGPSPGRVFGVGPDDDDDEDASASLTPSDEGYQHTHPHPHQLPRGEGQGQGRRVDAQVEGGEEDIDPFDTRVVSVSDEEHSKSQSQSHSRTHSLHRPGHQRSTSAASGSASASARAGVLVGFNETPTRADAQKNKKRMMTSTQELNVKSQFLMNMGMGGSAGSGSGSGSAMGGGDRSRVGLSSASRGFEAEGEGDREGEGEEVVGEIIGEYNDDGDDDGGDGSQLGPGSDFFK